VKFFSLQALRAIAAIAVVIYHSQGLCHKYASGPSLSEAAMKGVGQYGVDLFFVLSGFVILYTVRRTDSTAGAFLARRLIRIVPLYWILTVGLFLLPFLVPAVISSPAVPDPRTILRSLLFVSYLLNTQQPILYVGWSVEYEMLFYVLAALALLASLPLYRTLGLIFVAVYALLHLFVPLAVAPGNARFFLGNQQVFEFVLGLFLAELALNGKPRLLDVAIPIAAVALTMTLEGGGRFLLAGLPAAVIVWAAVRTEHWTARYGATRWFAKVGDASYSIYLVQVLILPAVGKLVARFVPNLAPDLLVLLATAIVVGAGMLLYRVLERPLLKRLQAALAPPRAVIAAVSQVTTEPQRARLPSEV
jgi:exopolysaccharide production protein ExoZ